MNIYLKVKILQHYIDQRNKSQDQSLINSNIVNESSFASKYAKASHDIQKLKRDILDSSKIREIEKLKEVRNKKKEFNTLMAQFRAYPSCTYYGKKHKKRCLKCIIEEKAKALRCEVYEKPLPEDEIERDIVVFELCMPKTISLLRDSLFIIKRFLLEYETVKTIIYGYWINYPFLKPYFELSTNFRSNYVALGSKNESFALHSHDKYQHPSLPEEVFVLNNKYSLNLSTVYLKGPQTNHIIKFGVPCFKTNCTFKVDFPYTTLQFAVDSNLHTENEVLSEQFKCPKELTKKEFIKYGCLRAGASLQLKNLLASLEARELSFENINVFKLIAQTIWEMGDWEIGPEYTISRSHGDLKNTVFVDYICKTLSELLDIYKEKWNDHYVLLNIIVITSRLIDHAPELCLKEKLCKKLMLPCRKIANKWEKDIEENRKKTSPDDNVRLKQLIELEFEISIFSILTYLVSKKYDELKFVFNSNEHVVSWLCSIRTINEKKCLIKQNQFLKNLYRRVEICMIELENEFERIVENDQGQSLTSYLKIVWPGYKKGKRA